MKERPIRVGITIGDINGIGPEVIIKSLSDNRIYSNFSPVIYGSNKVFSHYKKLMNDIEFNYQTISKSEEIIDLKINIINVIEEEPVIELGKITEASGKVAMKALDWATKDLAANKIDVLVTAPICKDAIQRAGFKFPGHTEYLANLSGEDEALMFMVCENLKVAVVTGHIPLKDVPTAITKENIYKKIKMLDNSLIKDFGVRRSKIAVLGLNPHAGENGKIGQEEKDIIIPAIEKARNEGILAFGPYPADSFFGSVDYKAFDAILAMYHDQGLTAFKTIAFQDGVNYTAALPIVRTSPDHGTAFDIAGQNKASEHSMRNAIYYAIDIYHKREEYKEINKNPLPLHTEKEQKN